jgi:hypothetical protein
MPDKKFDLGDYVEVKDRINLFYELYANGRLVTHAVEMLTDPANKQRVMVTAYAYRTPDDTLPGVGTSWMELPGTTPYTKGSEVENAETSAWGRAIAALGILVDRSIASAQEVANKQDGPKGDQPDPAPDASGETELLTGRVSRRGIIRKGGPDAYQLVARETPDGHAIGFRLEIDGDKAIPQVITEGPIGSALLLAYPDPLKLLGTAATVSGILYNVRGKQGSWYRLHVDRFENADIVLPVEVSAEDQAQLDLAIAAVP